MSSSLRTGNHLPPKSLWMREKGKQVPSKRHLSWRENLAWEFLRLQEASHFWVCFSYLVLSKASASPLLTGRLPQSNDPVRRKVKYWVKSKTWEHSPPHQFWSAQLCCPATNCYGGGRRWWDDEGKVPESRTPENMKWEGLFKCRRLKFTSFSKL